MCGGFSDGPCGPRVRTAVGKGAAGERAGGAVGELRVGAGGGGGAGEAVGRAVMAALGGRSAGGHGEVLWVFA